MYQYHIVLYNIYYIHTLLITELKYLIKVSHLYYQIEPELLSWAWLEEASQR